MYTAVPNGMRLPVDSSLFPLNVYMRLYIPHFPFIDASVERIIYIDVDMICETEIANLFFTNMHGKTIAAVLDARVPRFDNSWGGILNYKELNLPPDAPYFNAGIYLIDMQQWRANNYTEKVVDVIDSNTKFANYPDQYGLNIAFVNNWHMLDVKYNHFSSEPYQEQPFIIHYVSRKPIYKTYSGLPELKTIFYNYLNQTAYKGFMPIGESSRYIKKIGIVWDKVKAKLFK
jgi:lipopolysaccharide biosynthesis glycosyltransferase